VIRFENTENKGENNMVCTRWDMDEKMITNWKYTLDDEGIEKQDTRPRFWGAMQGGSSVLERRLRVRQVRFLTIALLPI
jgi:hypothetical protein